MAADERVEEGGGVEMKITAITKLQSSVSHTAPDGCTDPTLSGMERWIKKDGGSWRRLSWRRERVTGRTAGARVAAEWRHSRSFFILCRLTDTSVVELLTVMKAVSKKKKYFCTTTYVRSGFRLRGYWVWVSLSEEGRSSASYRRIQRSKQVN